jgi:hypothetical protein
MDKAALVSIDIETGAEILRALDKADLKVKVAAWFQLPEYGDWRLVLASRGFDVPDLRDAYGLIRKALEAEGFPIERRPTILVMRTSEPLIRDLRRIFGKTKSVEGMRLGGQTIGDRFIEDGYVYRIA